MIKSAEFAQPRFSGGTVLTDQDWQRVSFDPPEVSGDVTNVGMVRN